MAGSNITFPTISIDAAGATAAIQKLAREKLEECADQLIEIMKKEVNANGHGSSLMREVAAEAVRKELKEMSLDKITYEVGIDESLISGLAENFYVTVMVVLHGNTQNGGIWTKPGQMTFTKNILAKRPSPAEGEPKRLQFFDQFGDRSGFILDNSMKQIEAIFKDAMASVAAAINSGFLAPFIHVG